jgi:hypothetical protein
MTSLALASVSSKITIDPTGIQFHEELSFDEWNTIGQNLVPVAKSIGFIVGDWLNYGAARYGEKYTEATGSTGLAYETLKMYAHVARCVERLSRNHNLDWTHHKAVAKIKDPDEQRRWLQLADTDSMSVKRLRKSISAGRHLSREEASQDNDPADRGQVTYLSILNELRRWLKRETDKAPVHKWDDERRSALKDDFSFVVDFVESL